MKKLTFRALALRQSDWRNCGLCVGLYTERVHENVQYFPSQPFVVLTVNQFVGHGGGPLERHKQGSHVYRTTGTLPLVFSK